MLKVLVKTKLWYWLQKKLAKQFDDGAHLFKGQTMRHEPGDAAGAGVDGDACGCADSVLNAESTYKVSSCANVTDNQDHASVNLDLVVRWLIDTSTEISARMLPVSEDENDRNG